MPVASKPSEDDPENHAFILGEEEAYRIYLTEKVRRKEMTQTEADAREKGFKAIGVTKEWLGPARDAREGAMTLKEIAEEMGTWWAKVYFKQYGDKALIILKGNPAFRETIKGTRYKITNPKFVTWQIARSDMIGAARNSARIGLWIVCVADVLEYVLRDDETLGHLFGHLAVDIPLVVIAGAAGVLGQMAFVAGTAAFGLTVVAAGPIIAGFLVAVGVGYGLSKIDEHYHLSEKLGNVMDEGLHNLRAAYDDTKRQLQLSVDEIRRDFERARVIVNLIHDVEHLRRDLTNGWGQIPQWRMSLL